MTKMQDCEALLGLPLPLEMIAIILSYRDNWCGATVEDCLHVLKIWLEVCRTMSFDESSPK